MFKKFKHCVGRVKNLKTHLCVLVLLRSLGLVWIRIGNHFLYNLILLQNLISIELFSSVDKANGFKKLHFR